MLKRIENMSKEDAVTQLASLEVELINRVWGVLIEEEDAFEVLSRQFVDQPHPADLQDFINHALTGVLLAVAFHRFRETMRPFLTLDEIKHAFKLMTEAKARNVTDHWREPPEAPPA
jgi:hypothetical protein